MAEIKIETGNGTQGAGEAQQSSELVTKTYEIAEDFHSLNIRVNAEDVWFAPATDGKCTIVCKEREDAPHAVSVEDGTLQFCFTEKSTRTVSFSRTFFDVTLSKIGTSQAVGSANERVFFYLPKEQYDALTLEGNTGSVTLPKPFSFERIALTLDVGSFNCQASVAGNLRVTTNVGSINVSDLSARQMQLTSDVGSVRVANVEVAEEMRVTSDVGGVAIDGLNCGTLTVVVDSGTADVSHAIARDAIQITADAGNVLFHGCDAQNITVTTDAGSVTGTLRTGKIFQVQTDIGHVDVPDSTPGGTCKIRTDVGDVQIQIAPEA